MRFSHGRIPLGIGGSRFFYSIVRRRRRGEASGCERGKGGGGACFFPRVEALKYGPGSICVLRSGPEEKKWGGRAFFSNGHRGRKKEP